MDDHEQATNAGDCGCGESNRVPAPRAGSAPKDPVCTWPLSPAKTTAEAPRGASDVAEFRGDLHQRVAAAGAEAIRSEWLSAITVRFL